MAMADFDLMRALRTAGIADDATRRVVIDIRVGHLPVVHVEREGDGALLQVIEAVSHVEIVREEVSPDGRE